MRFAEDEQAVVALWRACDLVASYNDPVADFRFAKAGPCSDVLVAVDDAGEVAGSVMVGHDGHRGWLYYVAARPTSRSKGVGRRMVQAAENWLRQRGIVKVQLLVRETNTKVVSFYEHLGFEVAPRVVMSRWLGKHRRSIRPLGHVHYSRKTQQRDSSQKRGFSRSHPSFQNGQLCDRQSRPDRTGRMRKKHII